MKAGLTTSVVLHAALLGFGLFSLSAPRAFDVADVEALPVDIVPVESITQIQQGDKKAPLKEKPAPKPTKRPDIVPDAQEGRRERHRHRQAADAGGQAEAGGDRRSAGAVAEADDKVEAGRSAEKPIGRPKPVPATEVTPWPSQGRGQAEPVKSRSRRREPAPVKKAEPRRQPAPKPEAKGCSAEPVKPDTIAETITRTRRNPPKKRATAESAPAPEARPQPAEAQTAKAPDRKESEKPVKEASTKPKSDETGFDRGRGRGAPQQGEGVRRRRQALDADRPRSAAKDEQAARSCRRARWMRCAARSSAAGTSRPAPLDAENLHVSIKFKLDPTGGLEGSPEIIEGGGSQRRRARRGGGARRAVSRCAPYNLPADKYEAWADVIVNFDPSEMF